ncbi:exodeoxyribonuclease VII large subunit [Paenibacillus psychroresistens]|uniref:Exodeoxyribonuclease 7 large subunit n=1 Tax=Paenibacillus psychroresistens TaxID=1778678 RepID=A0A6B8RLB0_9BACL|nr:exodeoxyribonuclease VII large subunit [Paenibacillus psychroresistens]QGQ97100.1 exodeoxyribonuclease VII large subunit [Paenibacillus psychroresistens]
MKREAILSIKDLNKYIKAVLESEDLLQDVWVRGEISNFTHHSSGHMYFTLKDTDSRIKTIMFAKQNQRLPFMPREGTRVIARGNISVYERDGQYQFYVTEMQPDGIGGLYMAYEQLKQKLEAEGLFAASSKKQIPRFPKAIGIITSPTGAAVRDIIITLQRRFPTIPILLYPVLVQGTQAAPAIVKAIKEMNARKEVDLLIVGRGGGSLEELWAFNEEAVARSIFASVIPIISAVGHETDFTIADFAADLRAATPTAAAELAVPHHMELRQQMAQLTNRLQRGLFQELQAKRERLERVKRSPYLLNPRKQLIQPTERLDRLTEQLRYKIQNKVTRAEQKKLKLEQRLSGFNPQEQVLYTKRRVGQAERQLLLAMQTLLKSHQYRWNTQLKQLDALSPLKVMQRGYSLVYDENKKNLIKSVTQVQLGDIVNITLKDGRMDCHIWAVEEITNGQD